MQRSFRSILPLFACLAVAVGFNAGARAQTLELKYAHQSSASHPFHLAGQRFNEELSKRSGNRMTVRVFPAAQLGSAQKALEGILLGNVDVTPAGTALLASFVPDLNALNMPFLLRDAAHFDKVFAPASPVTREIVAMSAARGYRYLCMYTAGERHFITKRPVRSMDDLKGLKVRSAENPAYIAAFSAFGTNPVALAYPELYGALQTGVIDGADAAPTNYMVEKFYEVAPNFGLANWITFINSLVMSEAKFRTLSSADQQIVTAAAEATCAYEVEVWRKSDDENLELMRKQAGITVTTLNPVPLRQASEKVYEQFMKTDGQKRLLKLIQDTK